MVHTSVKPVYTTADQLFPIHPVTALDLMVMTLLHLKRQKKSASQKPDPRQRSNSPPSNYL